MEIRMDWMEDFLRVVNAMMHLAHDGHGVLTMNDNGKEYVVKDVKVDIGDRLTFIFEVEDGNNSSRGDRD